MIAGKQREPMSDAALPPRSAFPWYLTSSSLWMAGMSLQGFLFTWLLVGVLDRPADEAGFARSLAEFPPLIVLLVGGILGDRINGRTYLSLMHVFMCLPPLLIAMIFNLGLLSYWWVVLFGVLMSSIQALSDPARQSVLSRVTRIDIQRTVTVMTIATSLVGMAGFYLGGQLDVLGLEIVLMLQAMLFFLGLFATQRLPHLPMPQQSRPNIAAGIKAVLEHRLIRNIVGLNFLSSLFNAGAYIVAVPYIVKEVYSGDAALFATVMIVFTAGGMGSNVILLMFMPLRHPGRLFLLLQLTRMLILFLLWTEPSLPLFYVMIFAWGLNMGSTTTMVRATVQELAPMTFRAQILSVLLLSFMVSSPISSILLGVLISMTSPLTALIPGIVISMVIFTVGCLKSGLWQYTSSPPDLLANARPG
ncbi:MAG: MFS transporter [Gammaproteobacteria bacterium]|nr:MFS transporter [Gammaproteobacteria bacterium]